MLAQRPLPYSVGDPGGVDEKLCSGQLSVATSGRVQQRHRHVHDIAANVLGRRRVGFVAHARGERGQQDAAQWSEMLENRTLYWDKKLNL